MRKKNYLGTLAYPNFRSHKNFKQKKKILPPYLPYSHPQCNRKHNYYFVRPKGKYRIDLHVEDICYLGIKSLPQNFCAQIVFRLLIINLWCFCRQLNIMLPIIFVGACLFLVVMGTIAAPMDTLIGVLITLTGFPVYFIGVWWKKKPKCLVQFSRKLLSCIFYSSSFISISTYRW